MDGAIRKEKSTIEWQEQRSRKLYRSGAAGPQKGRRFLHH